MKLDDLWSKRYDCPVFQTKCQGFCHYTEKMDLITNCPADLGPWGAWRSCGNEITAFVATTWRDDLTTDTWYALALYWCGNDDNQCGIDELLDAVGWSL